MARPVEGMEDGMKTWPYGGGNLPLEEGVGVRKDCDKDRPYTTHTGRAEGVAECDKDRIKSGGINRQEVSLKKATESSQEAPQKSTEHDQARLCTDPSNSEEIPVEVAFRSVIRAATILGFHLCQKDDKGEYHISHWHILPSVLIGLLCLTILVSMAYFFFTHNLPYWYLITSMPCSFAYVCCVYAYCETLRNATRMRQYLAWAGDKLIKSSWHTRYALLGLISYPLTLSICTLMLIPGWKVAIYVPMVGLTSFVPTVLDIYIGSFTEVHVKELQRLTRRVRGTRKWRVDDVNEVFSRWMDLTDALSMFNKIFSRILHVRLELLLLKSLAYLFVLCAIPTFDGDCSTLFVITLVPLCETIKRLHFICTRGQELAMASRILQTAVREAVYKSRGICTEQVTLSAMLSRMEANPHHVLVWGMDSLTNSTFTWIMGLTATYLVLVLQFNPEESQWRNISPPLTNFDHCYTQTNTAYLYSNSSILSLF